MYFKVRGFPTLFKEDGLWKHNWMPSSSPHCWSLALLLRRWQSDHSLPTAHLSAVHQHHLVGTVTSDVWHYYRNVFLMSKLLNIPKSSSLGFPSSWGVSGHTFSWLTCRTKYRIRLITVIYKRTQTNPVGRKGPRAVQSAPNTAGQTRTIP